MQDIRYLDKDGAVIGQMLDGDGSVLLTRQDQPAPKGVAWVLDGCHMTKMFEEWFIEIYPTPHLDGFVVLFPYDTSGPYPLPTTPPSTTPTVACASTSKPPST